MKKARRRRNRSVTVRMNETEYAEFLDKVKESDLSQQEYMIRAISGATITPSDEIITLKEIGKTFAELVRQLRGLGTNVNQMAHAANATGWLPTENDLKEIADEIGMYRKESENLWQLIRLSIGKHHHTGQ